MNTLEITFERPEKCGVPIGGLATALKSVQDAMRLLVEHLEDRKPRPGPPPKWVQEQRTLLLLVTTHPGSLVAELTLESPPSGQAYPDDYGSQAFDALRCWDGNEDSTSTLPASVTGKLCDAASALPEDTLIFLGSAGNRIEIKRRASTGISGQATEQALLYGWLHEVNWKKSTAQLYDHTGGYIPLRFEPALNEKMRHLAMRYIEIRGHGRLNNDGDWAFVQIEQVSGKHLRNEPLDLDKLLSNPHPKIFDPEKVITASEPFDVDEFNRIIHQGREVRRQESAE